MGSVMNFTKSLSVPKLKEATLFIGYLNAAISILFVIVCSSSLSNGVPLFGGDTNYNVQTRQFFDTVNNIAPPIIITLGLVCFGFTTALIAGTHMRNTQWMRVYFSFGVISFALSLGVMSLVVIIMAFLGRMGSMIFAMQTFFFFGVYVVELHVIQKTIELFESDSPVNTHQHTLAEDDKESSLPPYEKCEIAPRLTIVQ